MIVIIPSAGKGTRLKPHTLSTPKPLLEVAGKPIIKYIIEEVQKLKPKKILVVVKHKKEEFEKFLEKNKEKNIILIEQEEKKGDAIAIKSALKKLDEKEKKEELLIFFGDTLIDFNIKEILTKKNDTDSLVFVKKVEEPQHYGVIELKEKKIVGIEEKPEKPKSNLALIGAYYFKNSKKLEKNINYLIKNNITYKGEYKLADVLKKMIEEKQKIKPLIVKEWYDCGRPETLLEANKYFLRKKSKNKKTVISKNSLIIPPVSIGKNTKIKKSIIGKNVSISKNVIIENSIIEDSIISEGAIIKNIVLKNSIIGKNSIVESSIKKMNLGEKNDLHLDF